MRPFVSDETITNTNCCRIGYFRPILSCPGIIPLALTLCWSGQTRLAAILSPVLGFFTGLAIWLGTAKALYHDINMATTEQGLPALYGACGSLFSPAIYSVIISLYKPTKFDWRQFLRIELADEAQLHADDTPKSPSLSIDEKKNTLDKSDDKVLSQQTNGGVFVSASSNETVQPLPSDSEQGAAIDEDKKHLPDVTRSTDSSISISLDEVRHPFSEETLQELHRWYKIAWIIWIVIVLVTFIAWPMPLYRNYIFTKSFFSGWTTVAIIWQFFAFFAVVVYPLYDGRYEILTGVRGVYKATRSFFKHARREKA